MRSIKTENRLHALIGNLSSVLVSNLLSLLVSTIVVLILPKYFSEGQYGYCQLYILYITYVGVFQIGWCDGAYLRTGGSHYESLNKGLLSSQFWLLLALNSIVTIGAGLLLAAFASDPVERSVYLLAAFSGCLSVPRTYLHYIFQATNRIRDYAANVLLDRALFAVLLLLFLTFLPPHFTSYIYADLLARALALVFFILPIRRDLFRKWAGLSENLREITTNIRVGIKLLIANFAAIFIIGIIRISIQNYWGIEAFGKVSLTLSVSNLILAFISAVAIIAFPLLRRVNEAMQKRVYLVTETLLMTLLFLLLLAYYPLREILAMWLPKYAESLKYMALLFPMCLYESRMSLLSNTYLKTLRHEKKLLVINLATLMLSFLFTGISVYGLHQIDLAVASIVLLLAFRSTYADIVIAKVLHIPVMRKTIMNNALALSFILFSWFLGGIGGFIGYMISLLLYLIVEREKIQSTLRETRKMANEYST